MTLDEIARKYNTDKSSVFHNYTEKYERYFGHLRNEPLTILEIGIQNGFSLKTWKEYFPNATIYGIDIVDCSHMNDDRVTTLQGSQNDTEFLQHVVDHYGPFDIIIDDGSHYNTDMKISFDFLFPYVKPGGIYVVEDLHCVYWPEFSDGNHAFMNRLKGLMDMINGNGKYGLAEINNSNHDHVYQNRQFGEPTWWEQNLDSIHLHRSIVFITRQKNGTTDMPSSRTTLQVPSRLWRLSGKILRRLKNEVRTRLNTAASLSEVFRPAPKKEAVAAYRKGIKIYDGFIFFNELDLLELRLNILADVVDCFVIVEATRTFTGKPKPLYYKINKDRFAAFNHKIIHIVVEDLPDSLKELEDRYATASEIDREIIDACFSTTNIPKDQPQWLREFYQKEQIKKGFNGGADTDICYISDIDEIWNPDIIVDYRRDVVFKYQELVYAYYLNNRSSESWYGSIATKYKRVRHASINHLDTPSLTRYVYVKNGGWHFTHQGGIEQIKTKLESYGHQEFNTAAIKGNLEQQVKGNKDFIGRRFTFWTDESALPSYILEHKDRYSHLFKTHD
jgi:beta-1,4-mannosyl-glycoprotein beta-1,4-N-acetylglucosaminyltransferase